MRGCYLEGIVTNSVSGLPINSVAVNISTTMLEDNTKVSGEYKLGTAIAGTYSVTFEKWGYDQKTLTGVILSNGNLTTLDVALVEQQSFALSGQIVRKDDQSEIPDALVDIQHELVNFQVQADVSGSFTVDPFYPGTYDIVAGKWGFVTNGEKDLLLTSGSGLVIELEEGWYDDFTFDFGWTATGGSQRGGEWVRVVPDSTGFAFGPPSPSINPSRDVLIDWGDKAYVTGNSGTFDFVSNGIVTLTSPVFDLSKNWSPYINFHSWFNNFNIFGIPDNDSMTVVIDNGVDVAVMGRIMMDTAYTSQWKFNSYNVWDVLDPTATMQISFNAYADIGFIVLEVGLDLFQVIDSTPVVISPLSEAELVTQAYPNPFTESTTIFVNGQLDGAISLSVFDIMGRQVRFVPELKGDRIRLFDLEQGFYFYQFSTDHEVLATGKLIAQ